VIDPSRYCFRTVAEFEVAFESAHDWLNRAMFIGVAERLPVIHTLGNSSRIFPRGLGRSAK